MFSDVAYAQDDDDEVAVEDDIGKAMDGSRTDDEVVQRYVNFVRVKRIFP